MAADVQSENQRNRVGQTFDLTDVHGRGELGGEDVEALVEQLVGGFGIAVGSPRHAAVKQEVNALWQVLRQDLGLTGDEKVGREQYVARYAGAAHSAVRQSTKPLTDLLFELFDADGDGRVSPSEFAPFLRAWSVPEEHIQATFQQLDAAGAGHLSREQLAEYLGGFILGNVG